MCDPVMTLACRACHTLGLGPVRHLVASLITQLHAHVATCTAGGGSSSVRYRQIASDCSRSVPLLHALPATRRIMACGDGAGAPRPTHRSPSPPPSATMRGLPRSHQSTMRGPPRSHQSAGITSFTPSATMRGPPRSFEPQAPRASPPLQPSSAAPPPAHIGADRRSSASWHGLGRRYGGTWPGGGLGGRRQPCFCERQRLRAEEGRAARVEAGTCAATSCAVLKQCAARITYGLFSSFPPGVISITFCQHLPASCSSASVRIMPPTVEGRRTGVANAVSEGVESKGEVGRGGARWGVIGRRGATAGRALM